MKCKVLAVLLFSITLLSSNAWGASGALDPTFGNAGVVQGNSDFIFADAALAPNGDILVTGSDNDPGVGRFATVARYLPNGTPDASFGTDGVVTLPPPSSFFLGTSFTMALAVQPNGKILLVFFAFNNTSTETETLLLRLNVNGTTDTTFGAGGQVNLDFPVPTGWGASVTLVLAQPDGKILLSGNVTPPFRNHSAPLTLLARYLATGAPDTSFGNGGFVEEVSPVDLPNSIALRSDDSFTAVNTADEIAQFSSTGAVVSAPSSAAIVLTKDTGVVALQSNGEYLEAGTVAGPIGRLNFDAEVVRFEATGVLDSSYESSVIRFGADGPSVKNVPAAIAVDAAGRGVLAVEFESTTTASGIARLNTNGSLDTTFGNAGIGSTVPGFVVFAVLVQSNNQPIMVGGNGSLARFLAQ